MKAVKEETINELAIALSQTNMSDLIILYDELFDVFEELVEITGSEHMAYEFLLLKELEKLQEF